MENSDQTVPTVAIHTCPQQLVILDWKRSLTAGRVRRWRFGRAQRKRNMLKVSCCGNSCIFYYKQHADQVAALINMHTEYA